MDVRMASKMSVSRGLRIRPWPSARKILAGDERGQALLEFALVSVVLLLILIGIIQFGFVFNNYIALTNATNIGAQALALSRNNTSVADPCAYAAQTIQQASPFLKTTSAGGLTFSISFYAAGSTPSTPSSGVGSPSCKTTTLAAGEEAAVTAFYPCNLNVYGTNFASNCSLKAQTVEDIQ